MQTVNIHEAKTHLSRFVDQAAAGEEVLIARAGKPVARLVALAPTERKPRHSWAWAKAASPCPKIFLVCTPMKFSGCLKAGNRPVMEKVLLDTNILVVAIILSQRWHSWKNTGAGQKDCTELAHHPSGNHTMPFSVALLRKMDSVPPDLKEVLWLLLEEIDNNGKPRSRKPTSINSETSSVMWPRRKSEPSSGSRNWPRRKSGPSSGSRN